MMEILIEVQEKRHLIIPWGLICFSVVVGLGLLANQKGPALTTLFFLAALGLPWLATPKPSSSLFTIKHQGWKLVLLGSILVLGSTYFIFLIVIKGYLKAIFIHPALNETFLFLVDKVKIAFPLALAEEFFFRGYLQETVFSGIWVKRSIGPFSYKNLATSLLFGLAHVVTYLSPLELLKVFSGLGFGWLVERSRGSIWPAVAVHTIGNLAIGWFKLLVGLNIPL